MKLDFDVENIRKNKIELLDCQVDLILRSLEFYAYTYQFIYPRFGDSVSKEENLRIDTYEQIMNEYSDHKTENRIGSKAFEDFEKNFGKIA